MSNSILSICTYLEKLWGYDRRLALCVVAAGKCPAPVISCFDYSDLAMEQGNFSNTKSVGKGVHEFKIYFGPGYRIYFGQDGEELIILVGGGTKKGQSKDIEVAQKYWAEYKKRKKEG